MSGTVVAVAGTGGSLASTVASNVAGLLARAGNRTLLVGTSVDSGVPHDLGLAEVAAGSVLHDVRPDLDVLVLAEGAPSPAAMLGRLRTGYDVVVVDGSGGSVVAAEAVAAADSLIVPVRPDRTSTKRLVDAVRRSPVPVLGVVVVATPVRPRAVLARTRRHLQDLLDRTPVFVAKIRSEVTVAWSARDRGLLVHELAAAMDRSVLDAVAVDAVLGLARDLAELAEEVVVRLEAGAEVGR